MGVLENLQKGAKSTEKGPAFVMHMNVTKYFISVPITSRMAIVFSKYDITFPYKRSLKIKV